MGHDPAPGGEQASRRYCANDCLRCVRPDLFRPSGDEPMSRGVVAECAVSFRAQLAGGTLEEGRDWRCGYCRTKGGSLRSGVVPFWDRSLRWISERNGRH